MSDATARKAHAVAELKDLHVRFRRPLLSYFLRRVGNLAEAEDLTQEVFFRLVRRPPDDEIAHRSGFVFATAINLIRDRGRQQRTRPAPVEISQTELESVVEDCAPDRVLLGKERLAEVLACLDELPPRTRDAFLLFRVERMRQRDIAKALGLSVSSVEKLITRAAAHLTQRFATGSEADEA
jgi:RNA polymerase sigma-70 factor (ECF subfamily)